MLQFQPFLFHLQAARILQQQICCILLFDILSPIHKVENTEPIASYLDEIGTQSKFDPTRIFLVFLSKTSARFLQPLVAPKTY